jgi:hypothetical protein
MPNTYPTIPSGMTSGITAVAATADVRTFNFDTYNWTPVQNLINFARVDMLDLPRILGNGFTLTIIRRAVVLNKISFPRKIQGRDFR